MARASRWWKVALQVNTPHGNFQFPSAGAPQFDLESGDGRKQFAEWYVAAIQAAGYHAIAITDHNTYEWYEEMAAAGEEAGLVVFPGCELTTGGGSDGVHLLLVGDPVNRTSQFDRIFHKVCQFDDDHPPFHPTTGQPIPAKASLLDILDGLPDDVLAIAPHALNENGMLSGKTLNQTLRWRAFHADSLAAIDVGDPTAASGSSWNSKLRRRALDDYPGLDDMPFVECGDIYSLDDLATSFTWIRMAEPSFEGLRQAFLDRTARIRAPWDLESPDVDPNDAHHGWIESVRLEGDIGVSNCALAVDFDPHLNVLVGGRGAGKSTVIGAIRKLYSDGTPLPPALSREWLSFSKHAYANAELEGVHRLPVSSEPRSARWEEATGSVTQTSDGRTADTEFRVRVVSQKELFELTLAADEGQSDTSRGLLEFVDSTLGIEQRSHDLPESVQARLDSARGRWRERARELLEAEEARAQLAQVSARLDDVRSQLDALEDDEAAQGVTEARDLVRSHERYLESLDEFTGQLEELESSLKGRIQAVAEQTSSYEPSRQLNELKSEIWGQLLDAVIEGSTELASLAEEHEQGTTSDELNGARQRVQEYQNYLEQHGVRQGQHQELLAQQTSLERQAEVASAVAEQVSAVTDQLLAAWTEFESILSERRALREELFDQVAGSVDSLRFDLHPRGDLDAWIDAFRERAGLRENSYSEELRRVGEWLFGAITSDEEGLERSTRWRQALIRGETETLSEELGLRATWWERLRELDRDVRLACASTVPEDLVEMWFRVEVEGSAQSPWQPVSDGSPGQRSAAMLSFILAHGDEPLVLDQPEDDLDSEWVTKLVVEQLRAIRSERQVIVATHNANIPVNGDAERITVLENAAGCLRVRGDGEARCSGPIEVAEVRASIQDIMEGGVSAFVKRELKYNNELSTYRQARGAMSNWDEADLSSDAAGR